MSDTAESKPDEAQTEADEMVHRPGAKVTAHSTDWEPGLLDQIAHLLGEFETRLSDDCVKRDLELIHARCGEHICDVEPGDTLEVLARTAGDHGRSCPQQPRNSAPAQPQVPARRGPDHDQTEADLAANAAAAFDPGADPARSADGDHSLYPNIIISGARVFAYAQDGVLTVSADLDDALSGESPVWAAYGPASDPLVPVRITVQGTEVFRATAANTPSPAPPGEEDRMLIAISEGTDYVTEHLGLGDRDTDLANIWANAVGTAWSRPGQPPAWNAFIAENWSAEPGTQEDPATWRDWGQPPCADQADQREELP